MGAVVNRKEDWPARLNAAIDAARCRPFEWGVSDCALFAADVIEAMTGEDFGRPYRGTYNTSLGSLRAIRERGHDSIRDLMTSIFGQSWPPGLLQRGDIALWNNGHGDTLGIVVGIHIAAQGEAGVEFMPMHTCLTGWRI